MAVRPNLVNKQFNSPIKLYSQANVNETLAKQTHTLYNGAIGIDFHNLAKPANLANSAVLRMLEEEERSGKPGRKRVAWPPPPEESEQILNGSEPIIEQGSLDPNRFTPVKQAPPPQRAREEVRSPPAPPPVAPAPIYQPVNFELPKATVTLLPQAPVKQRPAPVFLSQPAATVIKGGARMRGDQKWPPESVKQQSEAENAARIALAKGPACRPRKVRKDYSSFFAQHALNPTYPGYKAPPGTQHYIEEGTSNL